MLFVEPFASILIQSYYIKARQDFDAYNKRRSEKGLPPISADEYFKAMDMFSGFTLSKDRPWTLSNKMAYLLQKVFNV